MVSAKCAAPPSSRSSRSTDVTTIWERPSWPTASATWAGSWGSSLSGRPVATLQKAQARVQTLPRIITVACFCFQHSPMFGQAASSQTVLSLRRRISARVSSYSREVGAFTRIQAGLRGIGESGRSSFSGWRGRSASMASEMDGAAIGVKHGLVHGLRQGGMWEDGLDQLALGGLQAAGDGIALDQLGDFRPDHMGAQ